MKQNSIIKIFLINLIDSLLIPFKIFEIIFSFLFLRPKRKYKPIKRYEKQ